ncbi:hypothetical protein FRC98_16585 [Lujinxingia vulgaris]|uniref:Uncharacterized protein n=1 Tax=Lujinxingia vulgaris TaxID=2600176 RepID=A0A5C6X0Q2_9DELT|nr:cation:proton antiporter [Lujinxingia vulgaris]TXD35431.1 hypothetical protein FRC98_16585 [Lujinxingia vulgaris]
MREFLTLTIVLALLTLAQLVWPGATAAMAGDGLVAVGLMVLVAFATGEAFRRVGLPSLLGYIGAGVLLGPSFSSLMPDAYPLAIISSRLIDELAVVQLLVVALIGMLAGAKLRLADLREQARLVARITLAIALAVIPTTVIAVMLTTRIFPAHLAIFASEPLSQQLIIALFFGVLAFGLSPTITVALIQELRARGPLATAALSVVVAGEFLIFGFFAALMAGATLLASPDPVTGGSLAGMVPALLTELALSLGLGLALGVAIAAYARWVRSYLLLMVLASGVLAYLSALRVAAEPTLIFLVAGFFVQNATLRGRELVRALEQVALPVFVIYFATVAAGLDLRAAPAYVPLILVLVVVRLGALYFATRRVCARAVDTRQSLHYLPTAFIAQDAVVLVLAGVVAVNFPAWGPAFQSVVMATVIVYLSLGPIFLKTGLERSGEARRASHERRDERVLGLEEFELLEPTDLGQRLEAPRFDDAWLRGHIEDLRSALIDQAEQTFQQPIRLRRDGIIDALIELESVVDELIKGLREWDAEMRQQTPPPEAGPRLEALRGVQRTYLAQVGQVYERLLQLEGAPLTPASVEAFLSAVRAMEDKQTLYRIEREPALEQVEPSDAPWLRALKWGRRVRRRVLGAGYRNVPVGRLWSYHMELSLPVQLLRVTPPVAAQYEELWRALWQHLREVDRFLESLAEASATERDASNPPAEPDPVSGSPADETSPNAASVEARIAAFYADFSESHAELAHQTRRSAEVGLKGYGQSLEQSYHAFVRGVALAGTSQLPALVYRPSSRFASARRASSQLGDRLARQHQIIEGYRGWLKLDHQVSEFVQWSQGTRLAAERAARQTLGAGMEPLEALEQQLEELHDRARRAPLDWELAYTSELRPLLLRARRAQELRLARVRQGRYTRQLLELVEARVEQLPATIAVLSADPRRAIVAGAQHYELPLRRWVSSQVSRELALRVVDFNERAATRQEERHTLLGAIEQLLEFHLVTARRQRTRSPGNGEEGEGAPVPADLAGGEEGAGVQGIERALRALTSLRERISRDEEELVAWLISEWDRLMTRAFEPIEERRLGELQRELARQGAASFVARGESLAGELLEPLARHLGAARARAARWSDELGEELRTLLGASTLPADDAARRRALLADEPVAHSRAPSVYRRLFVPSPLDIPDFYRERGVEEQLLASARRWATGAEEVALIRGPRGSGKRTLARHLVPARIYGVVPDLREESVVTLSLSSVAREEPALSRAIVEGLGIQGAATRSFDDLRQYLQRGELRRRVIVVEDAQRLVLRTEVGVALTERFFNLVADSAQTIFWVLLMDEASADFAASHLNLDRVVTTTVSLPPADGAWLEAMILARHRVSGFGLSFEPQPRGRLERLARLQLRTPAPELVQREFFEALAAHARHNPRAALLWWLRAVRPDPGDDARLLVSPLCGAPLPVLDALSLEQRLLLAAITLHGSLSPHQAHLIVGLSQESARAELDALRRKGYLETLADNPDELQLRPGADAAIADALCRQNLI